MLTYDKFATPITFKLDGGSDSYRTLLGSICTLIMAVFILTYTGMIVNGMANGNSTVTILEEFDVFPQSY